MPTRKITLSLAVVLALAAAALWLWQPQLFNGAATPLLKPDDARLLAIGEKVYVSHCAACHGAQLEGQPEWRTRGADGRLPAPPHDASGHTWHHADEVLFNITKQGVAVVAKMPDYQSAMPVYQGVLSDEQIVAVLSWIKSRWPPSARERQDLINAEHRKAARP